MKQGNNRKAAAGFPAAALQGSFCVAEFQVRKLETNPPAQSLNHSILAAPIIPASFSNMAQRISGR